MTYKTFSSMSESIALEKLMKIWHNNIEVFNETIKFCKDFSIARYRFPSDLFPLATHPNLEILLKNEFIKKDIPHLLSDVGKTAKSLDVGISTHPSQFIVICSARENVRESAAKELNFLSQVMDMLGLPPDYSSPINMHLNVSPSATFETDFDKGISLLCPSAKKRLVFENEDKGYWNFQNLYNFATRRKKFALALDFLHHKCNPSGDISENFLKAYDSWRGFLPIFHYAESKSDKEIRAHSDFCKFSPPEYGKPYFCMIEAKAKDLAIERLLNLEH